MNKVGAYIITGCITTVVTIASLIYQLSSNYSQLTIVQMYIKVIFS